MEKKEDLLAKVNQILEKDMTHKSLLETIEDLTLKVVKFQEDIQIKSNHIQMLRQSNREYQKAIESLTENEEILLEQNKKFRLQIKELLKKTRLIEYDKIARENLDLAQELALIKGEISG